MLDLEDRLVPHRLPLGGSLEACVAAVVAEGVREPDDTTDYVKDWTQLLSPLVSLLLYLCSERPDVVGPGQPDKPKRIKGTKKLDVPKKVRHWDVAFRLGAKLRKAEAAFRNLEEHVTGTGESPRPHIRRAHWHLYWSGPKRSTQTLVVRWLSPITVAFGDDPGDLPAVARLVTGK